MRGSYKEIVVPAQIEKLQEVLSFLEQALCEADCSLKKQMQVAVAAEEIFVNIASYAYQQENGTATVGIEISDDPPAATITFADRGIPFDPLEKDDPDVTLSAEEREIGGLGIYMTKKVMDDVSYAYKDGQNILTLKKSL